MVKAPYENLSKMMIKLAVDADSVAAEELAKLDEIITKRGFTTIKLKSGETQTAVLVKKEELEFLRTLYESPI